MPSDASDLAARRGLLHRGEAAIIAIVSLLFTAAALTWSYRAKAACGGAPYYPDGRSLRFPVGDPNAVIPCYSDLMFLWVGRDIDHHVFPYIHGGINEQGQLYGGVVEYPVLSGLLMWLGAIGRHTDLGFFVQSALILTPFAIVITLLLAWLSRWWVLLWAATPPLVLYAFHNWELPVVFTSVAAIAVMAWGSSPDPATGTRRWSLRTSAIVASVLLAIGFSLKIYPGLFVVPLALYVLVGGEDPRDRAQRLARRAYDWAGAAWVVAAAVITTLIVQVPFMAAGFRGWKAALDFQGKRKADVDTNTFWHWGVRFLVGRDMDLYNTVVGIASPLLIAASLALAVWLAWRDYRRTGVFPWIPASFAMLSGFMLFHKVHSPQYTLWLLPFFVLLRVPWAAVAAYLVTDVILDLTIFRLFGIMNSGAPMKWWVIGGVNLAVWVHFVLLAYFLWAAVRMPLREPLASLNRTEFPPAPPLTRLADADAQAARHWLAPVSPGTTDAAPETVGPDGFGPVLTRGGITLRPLTPSDARALGAVAAGDPDLGRWTSGIPGDTSSALDWIAAAHDDPRRLAFAVLDPDGTLIGTTSYYEVDQAHRSLAIGYTYYAPDRQGGVVNPAAKLALLEYAFTRAGAVRVVWHTHEDNERSRAAISGLGADFEGLLAKHRRFADSATGWRTTAQYAMTDEDWPAAATALERRLGDRIAAGPRQPATGA